MRKLHFFVFLTAVILSSRLVSPVSAQQPTFGPQCEEGLTCTPTASPTQAVQATVPPASTVIPTKAPTPPRSGTAETTIVFLGFSILLIFGGLGLVSLKNS